MKVLLFLLLCVFQSFGQAKTATTTDGKKVILNVDKTWEYVDANSKSEKKVTLEFTHKDPNKQFQAVYEILTGTLNEAGGQISGFYNSGWKKSFTTTNLDQQVSFKVASTDMKTYIVTLNIYVDDKLAKTVTGKTSNLLKDPISLNVNLEEYK